MIRTTYDRNLKKIHDFEMNSISRQTGFGGVTETDGDIIKCQSMKQSFITGISNRF